MTAITRAKPAAATIDPRVEVAFAARSPYRSWVIDIEAPEGAEPTVLYAALVDAGWQDQGVNPPVDRYEPKRPGRIQPPSRRVSRRVFRRAGQTSLGPAWTEAESVTFIRSARAVLRRFGFTAVPLWRKTAAEG